MYSYGRDFDDNLEIGDIFRDYIVRRNEYDFMDRACEALSAESLELQKNIFDVAASKMLPFVQAAVNGIESAGFLNMYNSLNDRLISEASKDACDAALSFYGQFEEYREFQRLFGARRFLMESICAQMIQVEFLRRINCI